MAHIHQIPLGIYSVDTNQRNKIGTKRLSLIIDFFFYIIERRY